jgi:hypothetical protein
MGVACDTTEDEEERIQGSGEERCRKKPFRRTVHRCDIDIDIDIDRKI